MLNYVAALVLDYLIFDAHSYWRDTSTASTRRVFPQGKALPDAATLAGLDDPRPGGLAIPLGFLLAVARRDRASGSSTRGRGSGSRCR